MISSKPNAVDLVALAVWVGNYQWIRPDNLVSEFCYVRTRPEKFVSGFTVLGQDQKTTWWDDILLEQPFCNILKMYKSSG